MTDLTAALLANYRRLETAWGDPIPALDDSTLARADAAAKLTPTAPRDMGHGTLAPLAIAYRHRRDEKYARAAREFFLYWLDIQAVEKTWRSKGWDELEVPHTLGGTEAIGWFGALPAFLGSPSFDQPLLEKIVTTAATLLDHIAGHLRDGRNIRMTQLDVLLTQGVRLSFLPGAARWREVGLFGLNDMFQRHFYDDGGSIEATGWYHYICMNMALRFWRLGRLMPELGVRVSAELVGKAFDYTAAMVQPGGRLSPIGDCNGTTYEYTLPNVLARRKAVRRELGLDEAPPPLSQVFPGSQQAFLRDGWSTDATCITFDATRRDGYHWHPSRNSIQLYTFGSAVLADPGRMHYDPTPHRRHAVTTRAHSTMNLNGWDQSDADPTFRTRSVKGYDVVDSLYNGGYWPGGDAGHGSGVFGEHHRTLIWVHGRFMVVIDHVYHTELEGHKPAVESNWQFGPGEVTLDAASGRLTSRHGDARLLMLFPLKPAGMRMSVHEGENEPVRGWVADAGDNPVPAPWLTMRAENHDPWNVDMLTVLVPHVDDRVPEVAVREVLDPADGPHGKVVLQWGDGSSDELWWTRRFKHALGMLSSFTTDAGLLHLHKDRHGTVDGGLVFEGSILTPHGPAPLARRATFAIEPHGQK